MSGTTTATGPIERSGRNRQAAGSADILDEDPGAVQRHDPFGGLLHADELHQRLHVPHMGSAAPVQVHTFHC